MRRRGLTNVKGVAGRTAKVDAHQVESPALCHASIRRGLDALGELPALALAAERAQDVAATTLALFDASVGEHHGDEERELFPAVERSATRGEEAMRVAAIAKRLTAEHRHIESLWQQVRPMVRRLAAGRHALVDAHAVAQLLDIYAEHASFEETVYLPLAQRILVRDGNHMSALGLSLHMRHVKLPNAYV